MGLRIILDSTNSLTFYLQHKMIETLPDGTCVFARTMKKPDEWVCKWAELSEEEVKDVLEVLRTILEERLKNV